MPSKALEASSLACVVPFLYLDWQGGQIQLTGIIALFCPLSRSVNFPFMAEREYAVGQYEVISNMIDLFDFLFSVPGWHFY